MSPTWSRYTSRVIFLSVWLLSVFILDFIFVIIYSENYVNLYLHKNYVYIHELDLIFLWLCWLFNFNVQKTIFAKEKYYREVHLNAHWCLWDAFIVSYIDIRMIEVKHDWIVSLHLPTIPHETFKCTSIAISIFLYFVKEKKKSEKWHVCFIAKWIYYHENTIG